jgi:hypothetical protein
MSLFEFLFRAGQGPAKTALQHRGERGERRALLYAVVRECLTSAGILSPDYQFKVLSLDMRGQQHVIMIDLARQHALAGDRLSSIEGHIARHAQARHGILISAVYWRPYGNESVAEVGIHQSSRVKPPHRYPAAGTQDFAPTEIDGRPHDLSETQPGELR